VDNRTVGLRVIEGKDSAVRVEKRDGTADCNPYYLMACEIAAADLHVEQEELRLLQQLRDSLQLDRLIAAAIERGVRARHTSLD